MKASDKAKLISLLEIYRKESDSGEAATLVRKLKQMKKSNAGRKPKYSDETIYMVFQYRENGASIRKISEMTGCSVGYVQKLLKDHKANIHIHTKDG